ncbi:hypothetical protein [Streptomyces sp. NPDC006335]|uniref:hypothetical protein n=1 Tax=Streptomyces sp. NPDC006335 TaxID=3156895 RepID=UPI0033B9CEFD
MPGLATRERLLGEKDDADRGPVGSWWHDKVPPSGIPASGDEEQLVRGLGRG